MYINRRMEVFNTNTYATLPRLPNIIFGHKLLIVNDKVCTLRGKKLFKTRILKSIFFISFVSKLFFSKKVMSFGGTTKDCFVSEGSSWIHHSSMNQNRMGGAIIKMDNAVYAFGGIGSPTTFEYLPHGSCVLWLSSASGQAEVSETASTRSRSRSRSTSKIKMQDFLFRKYS